ncbi:DUF3124 domain-containing protein [Bradyrhizobium sp. 190]|uniref:DUF3124 domain-containing protein n=1 Tax=Bradyrhizobium sp. 190 TaxID=2782658 RepID=UPI001FF89A61|nr:DUF3124 domain-containing protein [Bradyrhizobium sp. 190]MCK1516933.1 DUF3124 domain-containing protein [Bradyrhizobium sp. 190]
MCHSHGKGAFLAILAALSILYSAAAGAQTGAIEQNFAASLTALPTENLAVSGAFYVPVYSSVSMSQGKLRADFSVTLSVHNAWAATSEIAEPTVEALMVGGVGAGHYAFISQGGRSGSSRTS